MGRKAKDMTGEKVGRWTVLRRDGTMHTHAAWLCECECGTQARIDGSELRRRATKSCGCLQAEVAREQMSVHGMAGHRHDATTRDPTYRSWLAMRDRCNRPTHTQWRRYGGRGITACAQWDDFRTFLRDMGSRPPGTTLDRIDNDGDYEPSNCRWATPAQQYANRTNRRGANHPMAKLARSEALYIRRSSETTRDLGERFGVAAATIQSVRNGRSWSHLPMPAVECPKRPHNRRVNGEDCG